jgi:oligopeptide/dipeptide ABC transporter ATP-binding protein
MTVATLSGPNQQAAGGSPHALLEVRDLTVELGRGPGGLRPVEGVSFAIERRQVVGLVGESGCGKSMTALSLMRLIGPPFARLSGEVLLEGRDLLRLSEREMRRVRGAAIGMVFQEPMTSLDPVYTIGRQMTETVRAHDRVGEAEARRAALEMLERVGITDPHRRMHSYPHELSGGMRQRVMIAIALLLRPKLLIADEPTTALDVTVQAQILELLLNLRTQLDMTVLLITHNLAVVAEVADKVVVMYAGETVERARKRELFVSPRHPYTRGLLNSLPEASTRGEPLQVIPGRVPYLEEMPAACRFAPRCPRALEICSRQHPELAEDGDDRQLRCWNPEPFAG